MDDETRHYAERIKIKQSRLRILEKQADRMGSEVPPHIEMERQSLLAELDMFETALDSPVVGKISDELGPRGRFTVNYQQNQDIKKSIATLLVMMETRFAVQRNWIILVGLVVILILIAFVVFVTYLVTKGAL